MRIVSRKAIREATASHSEWAASLNAWFKITAAADWTSFSLDVRNSWRNSDAVGRFGVVRRQPQSLQADRYHQVQVENGLHSPHSESCRIRREGLAKRMIAVSEKYSLVVGSPTPITSERQHDEYLSVLDKLASRENPTSEEEKYASVLMTLIEDYEGKQHAISPKPLRWRSFVR